MTTITLNDRELATVLAGLRIIQRERTHSRQPLSEDAVMLIATDNMRFKRLGMLEIDNLCERINTAPTEPELDTMQSLVSDLARLTTPEQEFADPANKMQAMYADADDMVADMDDERLCGEYAAFMEFVGRAQAIMKASGS
jgi:hypothetical protein